MKRHHHQVAHGPSAARSTYVLLRIQREDELDPPLTTDNIKAVIIYAIYCDDHQKERVSIMSLLVAAPL
jgi:hypothetical protein